MTKDHVSRAFLSLGLACSRRVSLALFSGAQPNPKGFRNCLLFATVCCFWATTSFAQNPSMSWGEQLLAINGEECMRRVPVAFRAEGFSPGSPSVNTTYATKGIHAAYLRCIDEKEKGRTRVIIVVASNSSDANVPGAERVKLQRQMDQSGAAAFSGKWRLTAVLPPGQPYAGSYTVEIDLVEQNGRLSGSGVWAHGSRSSFTGELRNGNVVLYRTDPNGFRGTFSGRLIGDRRMEGTGQNDPSSPGGNSASYTWTADRLP